MQHELQPDSLVDLKFIMADTGFGKTFIYDRIKSGDSILHSAMHSLMNSQDRDTRDRSLNDDNVLEISEPRI